MSEEQRAESEEPRAKGEEGRVGDGVSPRAMREFAARFTREEWEILCSDQGFLDTITEDLAVVRLLAERVLARAGKS